MFQHFLSRTHSLAATHPPRVALPDSRGRKPPKTAWSSHTAAVAPVPQNDQRYAIDRDRATASISRRTPLPGLLLLQHVRWVADTPLQRVFQAMAATAENLALAPIAGAPK